MAENTVIQPAVQEKPKVARATKKKEKNNGFNVPVKSRAPTSTKWAIYIFEIIKEAAPQLLEREDVKTAYNSFVECLSLHSPSFRTTMPFKSNKYNVYNLIIDKVEKLPLYLDYNYTNYNVSREERIKEKDAIFNSYIPLYELIKRDVIPYMQQREHEQQKVSMTKLYRRRMERNEERIKRLEASVRALQKQIEKEQKRVAEYATAIIKLDIPPEPVTFD